jgi:hypothetical protein
MASKAAISSITVAYQAWRKWRNGGMVAEIIRLTGSVMKSSAAQKKRRNQSGIIESGVEMASWRNGVAYHGMAKA